MAFKKQDAQKCIHKGKVEVAPGTSKELQLQADT